MALVLRADPLGLAVGGARLGKRHYRRIIQRPDEARFTPSSSTAMPEFERGRDDGASPAAGMHVINSHTAPCRSTCSSQEDYW